jgi:hypothetical protein
MEMERMPIRGDAADSVSDSTSPSSSALDLNAEWMERVGLTANDFFSESVMLTFAPPTLAGRAKWSARIVEGVALSIVVLLFIMYAALFY